MKSCLIVGQGIAGSLLAWELIERGVNVTVVDDAHKTSSSIISAGIINPVTGKRFALTDGYDMFRKKASETYRAIGQALSGVFFEDKPILRIFQNTDEQAHWQRKDELGIAQTYCQSVNGSGQYSPLLDDKLGSVLITRGGFCRSTALLDALKSHFIERGVLRAGGFSYDGLSLESGGVGYQDEIYDMVIFAEGYRGQFNPWFSWIPFNSVKGEILRIEMDKEGLPDAIINKGKWCLPLEKNLWSAGASWRWDGLDCTPSEEGKMEILDGINRAVKREKRVVSHQAAVRPVTEDQRPVVGMHPAVPQLGIFNGLGSKGFLVAPYYAACFADFLCSRGGLDRQVSTQRFEHLTGKTERQINH